MVPPHESCSGSDDSTTLQRYLQRKDPLASVVQTLIFKVRRLEDAAERSQLRRTYGNASILPRRYLFMGLKFDASLPSSGSNGNGIHHTLQAVALLLVSTT